MLVVAEDLHWADASTLDVLGRLIRRAPGTSMLLVATFRPEFVPERDQVGHVTQLTLARFDRMETEVMLGALLGDEPASPALAELVATRTDGVPLFIEEVVRTLRESGGLEDPAAVTAVPETLQDSLLARLDRLGEAKEIAQTAAVLAREFPYAMLAEIVDMDEDRLRAGLARLVDAGILYETRRWERESYLFKHALIMDAAYDSLLHARRRELHVRVAEAMQDERFRDVVLAAPDCVARHLTAADRAAEAIPHWRRASAASLGASAYAEALGQLEAGLALVEALPAEERDEVELVFQLRLGAAHMGLSGYGTPESRAAFARAEEVSRSLDESTRIVPALYGLIAFSLGSGEPPRAHALAQRLERIVEASGAEEVPMEGIVLLGTSAFLLGDLDEARRRLDRAVALWDPEVHRGHTRFTVQEPGVVALAMRGVTLGWQGEIGAARRSVAEGVEAGRAAEHPLSLCYALGAAGVLEQALGEVERVEAVARELLAVGGQHRLPVWQAWGRAMHGWVTVRRGEVAAGVDEALAGLDVAAATGFASSRSHFLAALGDACLRADAPDDALRLADEALPLAGPEGERVYEADLLRIRGCARGDEDEVERALEGARSRGARLPELRAAHALSELRGTAEPLATALAGFPDGDGAAVVREAEAALQAAKPRA
jgi:tetratricopeptide (TPR) repeat protein